MNIWNFSYDAGGMLTSRTDGIFNYTYVYNGDLLMRMTINDNVLEFAYDASGTPMTVTLDGVTYYYLTNIQGDVVSIIDGNGALVAHYNYDAWGNLIAEGSLFSLIGSWNPLRYRGYVYDEETELYYLQSRCYNPEIGRFINADAYISTGGLLGHNMFAYCGNNPVMYTDPFGYGIWEDICDYFAWCGDIYNQQLELDTQIRLQQIELISNGAQNVYNSYNESIIRQQEVDNLITQTQVELIQQGANAAWDAYMFSYELEIKTQHDQTIATNKIIADRFSTNQKAANTISYVGNGGLFCMSLCAISIAAPGAAAAIAVGTAVFSGIAFVGSIFAICAEE